MTTTIKTTSFICQECGILVNPEPCDCETVCMPCANEISSFMEEEAEEFYSIMEAKEDDSYYCYTEED